LVNSCQKELTAFINEIIKPMNTPKMISFIFLYFMILIAISITACTSKLHVRLFTANLSQEDLAKIENKFTASNVLYSISVSQFPESIAENSIIYTPSIDSNKSTYGIIKLLESLDFNIAKTALIRVDNHSFTANNIGLYLISNGIKRDNDKRPLFDINEFGGVECGSNLKLNADSTFTVSFDIWDSEFEDYREISVTGFWKMKNAINLVLNSENWQSDLSFNKKMTVVSNPEGNFQTISLVPLFNSEQNGSYLNEPDSEPNINCFYQTTIIN